jgi:hypothetical protein
VLYLFLSMLFTLVCLLFVLYLLLTCLTYLHSFTFAIRENFFFHLCKLCTAFCVPHLSHFLTLSTTLTNHDEPISKMWEYRLGGQVPLPRECPWIPFVRHHCDYKFIFNPDSCPCRWQMALELGTNLCVNWLNKTQKQFSLLAAKAKNFF